MRVTRRQNVAPDKRLCDNKIVRQSYSLWSYSVKGGLIVCVGGGESSAHGGPTLDLNDHLPNMLVRKFLYGARSNDATILWFRDKF